MLFGFESPKKNPPPKNTLQDGDLIDIRNGRVLHTPGHTQGSLSFYFEEDKLLVTGDTLFNGGIGRTDLPGGSMPEILRSIKEKILILPEDVRIIAGHGPETTVGQEKRENPFLTN